MHYNTVERQKLIEIITEADPDVIQFLPPLRVGYKPNFDVLHYITPGNKLGKSNLGDLFSIILFRIDDKENVIEKEKFEAVLIQPMIYILRILDLGFYGFVARLTDKSEKFIEQLYEGLTLAHARATMSFG